MANTIPMPADSYKLGFIGGGKMAESIARGVVKSELLAGSQIRTARHALVRHNAFESFGVKMRDHNKQLCSTMEELKQCQAQIIKLGCSSDNDAMGRVIKFCALSKSGDLNHALKVFAMLPLPDAFVYNIMLRGYLQENLCRNVILFYSCMLERYVMPNEFTFPPLIRACSIDNAIEEGKQVHGQLIKLGFGQDSFCQNNLIHMYVNFGSLDEAKRVFDKFDEKDDVSWTTLINGFSQLGCIDEVFDVLEMMSVKRSAVWNALIAAYVQNNRFYKAFSTFDWMLKENVVMDNFVAASMLSACIGVGALEGGDRIYEYIRSSGVQVDPKLATTIIDMYCKCGHLEKALEVFKGLPCKGISSWNCMIGGLGMHGRGKAAVELFKEMEQSAVRPDYVTFVNVLSACAHSGLVKEGKHYFRYMTEMYGISPRMEHYGCFVDLLGRAGLLEESRKVIHDMPMKADASVLGALLGACRIHGNVVMGDDIGRDVIDLEPDNSGRYVLLANLYAKAGRWEDVANIRKLMNDRGLKKETGFSTIEFQGVVSEFIAGGMTHPQSEEIYFKLEEIFVCIRDVGYVPNTDEILFDISAEERDNPLHYHSEKLAIAFGLLKTKPGELIRVTKNLRVCTDCHEVSKLISKVYDREIIVRDRNRFHHFKGGLCSCKEYW
ncbi:pentatricopeptide repeat-containing protein At5g66520-like isoform X2 [Henckelia pumila]|uniref:pentatricopeptide repeat-containing protein At5g66520-like isoform X2 n=1 Tax=Henckelia pumila TaxID=405737 RepID=UPI003C6DE3E5